MKKFDQIVLVILVSVFSLAHPARSQDKGAATWPQFRGPNCSGVAHPSQRPPIHFNPEQNLLWKVPVISGHSSPSVWGDKIFLTGFDQEKQQLQVLCFNRVSGNVLWRQIVAVKEIEKVHVISNPANATPVTDGKRVYIYFGSYGLLCYDFAGEQLWTIPLPIPEVTHGAGSSPVIVGDKIILHQAGETDPHILAVDRFTGKTVWRQSLSTARGHSTPIIWGKQVIVHRTNEIGGYRLKDGERVWSVAVTTDGASTPILGDNILYVGTWAGRGGEGRVTLPNFQELTDKYDKNNDSIINKAEIPDDFQLLRYADRGDASGTQMYLKQYFEIPDKDNNSKIDSTEWRDFLIFYSDYFQKNHGLVAIKPGGNGDITLSNILWYEEKHVPEVPSPLYYKGRVYMIKNGGMVTCMDAKTGKQYYRQRLGASSPYYSSPIVANDRIYIASGKGVIVVFDAGDKLQVLARNDLKEKIFATPAVVDHKIYVRTAGHLYAFGK